MVPRTVSIAMFVCMLAGGEVHGQGDERSVLAFAEHLFQQGDYYRAITEYKRHLFANPHAPEAPWVRFRIGQSYQAGGRHAAALAVFDALRDRAHQPRLRAWASLAAARSLYLDGRYRQSAAALDVLLDGIEDFDLQGHALFLEACARLRHGDTAGSQILLASIRAGHPVASRAMQLEATIDEVGRLPGKSPTLAGILSLVPGLGHIYLEEYSIALTAFVWNGLFGYATYDAFQRGHHGMGTLLAAMSLLWYSGTMYGAIAGAHRYNRDARLGFLEGLDREVGLDVDFPPPGAVGGILLQGRF